MALFTPVYPHEVNKDFGEFEWTYDGDGEAVERERPPLGFVSSTF